MRTGTPLPGPQPEISPVASSSGLSINSGRFSYDGEEFVEITLDLHNDATFILRSIEPAGIFPSSSATTSGSVSPSIRRTPSNRLSDAVSRAKQFSQECKSEIKRFSRNLSKGSSGNYPSTSEPCSAIELALAARAARRQSSMIDRSRSGAQRALKGLRFISRSRADSWNEVETKFLTLAKDGLLCRSDFPECIGMMESKEFALELFDALSRRKGMTLDLDLGHLSDKISRDELCEVWSQITDQSFDSRLQIFFEMVNKNMDGRINEAEVKEIIMLSASANKLTKLKEQAEEYAALIMEELDPERLGYIELWQLESLLLQKDPYINYSQGLSYTSQAPSQNLSTSLTRKKNRFRYVITELVYYLEENWKRLWVLGLWVLIMAGLFTWKFIQYKNKYAFQVMGYCLTLAKGAAETLKLNMAIILLPVCRNTVTWLRSTWANRILPFDDNINFHKTIGGAILLGIILHVGTHLSCDFPRLMSSTQDEYLPMDRDFGDPKPTYFDLIRGPEGLTGLIMIVTMAISFLLATKWFRRSLIKLPKPFNKLTGFNAFWYSHHLFAIVYVLLVIHGQFLYFIHRWYLKTTWMYLVVPLCIYVGERVLRAFRSGNYSVQITKVAIYHGNVLTLQMSKPLGFNYKSGQYMFVQCPTVSPFEWHPFSITSAPNDEYLSIHVRQLGDWTRELKRVFAEACEVSASGKSGLLRADETTKTCLPKLLIDGPYGAPSQDYKNYDVLLLVGLGIGATPFISILKDLLNNIVKMEEQDEEKSELSQRLNQRLENVDLTSLMRISTLSKRIMKTTNAYFYWVTREQGSFDWFKGVMNEVDDLDQRGIIEMHNYLTSVYEEGDARSALITMLQSLNHAKNGVDIVSGTRVKTHFARPNWKRVFSRACTKHPNATIGVFYCGAPILAQELKKLCFEFNQKGTTKFEFHKEYF